MEKAIIDLNKLTFGNIMTLAAKNNTTFELVLDILLDIAQLAKEKDSNNLVKARPTKQMKLGSRRWDNYEESVLLDNSVKFNSLKGTKKDKLARKLGKELNRTPQAIKSKYWDMKKKLTSF